MPSCSMISTMRPDLRLIISGAACQQVTTWGHSQPSRKARLSPSGRFQKLFHEATGFPVRTLTSTSSRFWSFWTRANSSATSSSTVWSTRTAMPTPPAAVTSAAVSSIVSGRPA
jgi:hypothetical protein